MTRFQPRMRYEYATYKGRRYKIDTDHRMIWVILPKSKRVPYETERELDWIGPTAFAVRAQLKWEQEQIK